MADGDKQGDTLSLHSRHSPRELCTLLTGLEGRRDGCETRRKCLFSELKNIKQDATGPGLTTLAKDPKDLIFLGLFIHEFAN